MKNTIRVLALVFLVPILANGQIDKDQLALQISKADDANTEKLKEYIWKRKSDAFVGGQLKLTTLSEFSFDAAGKLQVTTIDTETTVKKKAGLRGVAQKNAAEDKLDYIEKALSLSLNYAFMTKGELLDFFSKATVTEKNGIIEAVADNVHVKGDKLTVHLDAKTKLYIDKTFSSLLGNDLIEGELKFDKFSNGTSHGTTTVLNMPAENMKINAINQDYTQRVK